MKKILLGLTGSLLLAMTAQAELIDNSNTHTGSDRASNTTEAALRYLPKFNTNRYRLPSCDCDDKGQPLANCQEQELTTHVALQIDEQGKVSSVSLVKSSGEVRADRGVMRDIRRAVFKPFMVNGQPKPSRVDVPIKLVYQPNIPASCYALRDSLQEQESVALD